MADGHATAAMPWAPVLTNVHGTIHGGAIATLVDIAAAMAARTSDPAASGAITVSLTTNFLIEATGSLRAYAAAVSAGRSLVTVKVDVRDERDNAVASAMAVMKLKRSAASGPQETRS
jgi:uncharacterized protein (TIGR00369 family)